MRASLCGERHVRVRTAAIHLAFREHLLRRVLDVQRMLGNMVLFCCTVCRERFPTWHPLFRPDVRLEVLRDCSLDVAAYEDGLADEAVPVNAPWAPLR